MIGPAFATKNKREDDVLASFFAYLRSTGAAARLIENPDRLPPTSRTYPMVTADALLAVIDPSGDRSQWAVDVMAAAADFRDYQIPDQLYSQIETIARASGVRIRIVGEFTDVREVNTVVQACKAASMAGFMPPQSLKALGGRVDVTFRAILPNEPLVEFVIERALTPPVGVSPASLVWQLQSTMDTRLTKKVQQQAAPARDVGLKIAILLDAEGNDHILQGTHWLPKRLSRSPLNFGGGPRDQAAITGSS